MGSHRRLLSKGVTDELTSKAAQRAREPLVPVVDSGISDCWNFEEAEGSSRREVKEGHLQVEPLQRAGQAGWQVAELVVGEAEGGDGLGATEGIGRQAGVAQLVVVEVHGPEGERALATSLPPGSPLLPLRTPAQGRLVCVCGVLQTEDPGSCLPQTPMAGS